MKVSDFQTKALSFRRGKKTIRMFASYRAARREAAKASYRKAKRGRALA